MHVEKTVKISSKGQITLPRQVREVLRSQVIRIIVEGSAVRIEPVRELAGSLGRYAGNPISMEEARERAWQEVVGERHLRD